MDYSERRKEQAQRTESAILQAALELMREDSFDTVTVRDICKKAGITTGAFYHHFQSKEDLFDKGFAPLDQYIRKALSEHPSEDPAVRLEIVLRSYAKFMEDCGELAGQYYQRRLICQDVVSIDASRSVRQMMVNCFQQAKEEGMIVLRDDPEWTADFCYRHFRGTVIDWLLARRTYSLIDKMMDEFELFRFLFQKNPQ